MEQAHAPAYRLVRRPVPTAPSARLDKAQQAVVDHAGGPLLVLAGPGTGKTTTIVAAVADRIERRGLDPERVLVLTFSRKAAAELRERITARLRRTTREPLAMTFHSYAYALARREFVLAGDEPPRLLSAPEQLLEVRRMLRGEAEDGGARWPEAPAAGPGHPGVRRGGPRPAAARGRARSGRPGAGSARQAARPRRLGGRRGVPGPVRGPFRPRPCPGLRLRGDRPHHRRPAHPRGDQAARACGVRRGVRR